MKIAIVTLHGYFNYGNRLQNYALQRVLEKQHHEVTTLAVENSANKTVSFLKRFFDRNGNKRTIKSISDIQRENCFVKFTNKHIKTHVYYDQSRKIPASAEADFDLFIVGSDQVWNPLFWEDSLESPELYNFLLKFVETKRKVSYAASFGISTLPETWKGRFASELKHFSALSVRESSGKEIIEDCIGKAVPAVLDPTMLLTAEEWREIESSELKRQENYVLTFFLGKQPSELQNKIREEARINKRKIIDLMDKNCPFYAKGPDTFLELIDNATLVYTDSFHATVFSILFHTPFVVFERNHANGSRMNSRITTLLSYVGIVNGISDGEIKVIKDFASMDKKLTEEREKSNRFLTEVLSK